MISFVRIEWRSQRANAAYDRRAPRRGGGQSVSYAYCSKGRPALLSAGADGRWEVDGLALNTGYVPPGVQENAAAIYFAV